MDVTERHDENGILTPLMLVGPYGRTGSTAVLYLLATSPQIALERLYPFEYRYLTYLIHWLRLLDQACPPVGEWNFDVIQNNECLQAMGPVPFESLCLAKTPPGLEPLSKRCLRAVWRECSLHFARTILPAHIGQFPILYYAEKMPYWAYEFLSTIIYTKGIFTLRDPRDVYLSGLAFDKKRGYSAFGPGMNASKEEHENYLSGFVKSSKVRLRRILKAMNSESEYVVRYENMMTDFENESQKLGDWLQVKFNSKEVFSNKKLLEIHATSASPKESTARWKRELSSKKNQLFIEHLGEELAELGYEV
jgi:hypothetical protein